MSKSRQSHVKPGEDRLTIGPLSPGYLRNGNIFVSAQNGDLDSVSATILEPNQGEFAGRDNQLISTVTGAAPTAGSELIRKRLPSGETAYWKRTIRGAMIRVWKRA